MDGAPLLICVISLHLLYIYCGLDAEIPTEHNRVLRLTNTNLVAGNQGGTKLATLILCVGIMYVGLGSFDLNVCLCV